MRSAANVDAAPPAIDDVHSETRNTGRGGDSTAFAVHVETAATHITMNPVAVNMQCHSARRARATLRAAGIEYGF